MPVSGRPAGAIKGPLLMHGKSYRISSHIGHWERAQKMTLSACCCSKRFRPIAAIRLARRVCPLFAQGNRVSSRPNPDIGA